jgi:molecular chaperone GrpE (heat shock protein)
MKAELENSRARMEREHARSVEFASERLVKELLLIHRQLGASSGG